MEATALIAAIDDEIARLTRARNLLSGRETVIARSSAPKRRKLSAEARKRIADAQRRRWAAQKSTQKKAEKKS
jgi:hypothetical protein